MTELRDIEGYEGIYSITRDGRVWMHGRQACYQDGTPHRYHPPRWMSQSLSPDGYPQVSLSLPFKKQKLHYVHILVAKTYIPNPDGLPQVNHKDTDRTNANDWNLEWVTPQGNDHHAMVQGNRKPRTTGYHGVSKSRSRYRISAPFKGKQHYLGTRDTPEEAARLYDNFIRLHNLDRPLNFP